MKHGHADRDTSALGHRIALQERFGSRDLNDWIIGHVRPRAGEHCLDLGCGTGKQSLALAEFVGEHGCITAVDVSQAALDQLKEAAKQRGFSKRIRTVCADLDSIAYFARETSYDLVIASYSIYYATDLALVLSTSHQQLGAGGRLFLCGPAKDNNWQMRNLVAEAHGEKDIVATAASIIMEETAPAICRKLFTTVSIDRFDNPVHFESEQDAALYWRKHNLYDPVCESRFLHLLHAQFEEAGEFINVKRAVGVLACD